MERLILVTNDDGIHAKGINELIEVASRFGKVIAVAPLEAMSGMSHAITIKTPIRVFKIEESQNITRYACTGTPVDCVKMAINRLLPRKPDLLLSGFNHGSNSSASVVYSGTMAAAIEGSINDILSMGISLLDYSKDADFTASKEITSKIINQVLNNNFPKWTCLNVNIPALPIHEIKNIHVCRQTRGFWKEEFDQRTDPSGIDYFWLTGKFENHEPFDYSTL